jgi:hypothetical protein
LAFSCGVSLVFDNADDLNLSLALCFSAGNRGDTSCTPECRQSNTVGSREIRRMSCENSELETIGPQNSPRSNVLADSLLDWQCRRKIKARMVVDKCVVRQKRIRLIDLAMRKIAKKIARARKHR